MSANNLSQFCGETQTAAEVVAALSAIRDAAASDIHAPRVDGISCFNRLYATITHTLQDTLDGAHPRAVFTDTEFTTQLTVDFARRHLDAILAYERRDRSTPRCWQVLFDHRRNPAIGHVNFAAAGANDGDQTQVIDADQGAQRVVDHDPVPVAVQRRNRP